MNELIAKPVVKNKMWIVEAYAGVKVGNIMAIDEGGFVYVHDNQREQFPSIKLLSQKYNITFAKAEKVKKEKAQHEVYGYPTSSTPHNQVLDVQRYLPIYTKAAKSKSFFCAGHYIVKYNTTWVSTYCPKLITLNRYEYQGPFKTKERMTEAMKEANGS
jgi:hypothetical protein